jgi:hypothetical protein
MVFLCAFLMFNVQLLLLSGIGEPYDFSTGKGVIGRDALGMMDFEGLLRFFSRKVGE